MFYKKVDFTKESTFTSFTCCMLWEIDYAHYSFSRQARRQKITKLIRRISEAPEAPKPAKPCRNPGLYRVLSLGKGTTHLPCLSRFPSNCPALSFWPDSKPSDWKGLPVEPARTPRKIPRRWTAELFVMGLRLPTAPLLTLPWITTIASWPTTVTMTWLSLDCLLFSKRFVKRSNWVTWFRGLSFLSKSLRVYFQNPWVFFKPFWPILRL